MSTDVEDHRPYRRYVAPDGRRWPSRLYYLVSSREWSEATERALSHPEEASKPNSDGWLPLHQACYSCRETRFPELPPPNPPAGVIDLFAALLGAFPEATSIQNGWGCVPLHIAVTSSYPEICHALLQSDGRSAARSTNKRGLTPLEWLCLLHGPTIELAAMGETEQPQAEAASYSDLEQRPFVDADGNAIGVICTRATARANGIPPDMCFDYPSDADELPRLRSILAVLLQSGTDSEGNGSQMPLLHACASLDRPCPGLLLRYAVSQSPIEKINPDEDGNLSLHVALSNQNKSRTARYLLRAYPDAAAVVVSGMLPLHLALRSGMSWHGADSGSGRDGCLGAIYDAHRSAVQVTEPGRGLFPFMVAAVRKEGRDGDGDGEDGKACVESTFCLLQAWPQIESMRGK